MLADGRRGLSVGDVAPVVLGPLGATPSTDPSGRILVTVSSVTTVVRPGITRGRGVRSRPRIGFDSRNGVPPNDTKSLSASILHFLQWVRFVRIDFARPRDPLVSPSRPPRITELPRIVRAQSAIWESTSRQPGTGGQELRRRGRPSRISRDPRRFARTIRTEEMIRLARDSNPMLDVPA
jgi:hypothetical protein